MFCFFFSSRRRHTRCSRDWSSDVCSSDLVLLPTDDTAIRRKLDQWFAGLEIEPKVIGEFEDFALLRVFGQAGAGIVPVPTTLEKQFHNQDKVIRLGIARNVFGRFYAISAERKLRHS